MKNTLIALAAVLVLAGTFILYPKNTTPVAEAPSETSALSVVSNFGAGQAAAVEGPHAVGIIVKNGSKMDQILSQNFTTEIFNCDQNATSTDPMMCERNLYQGQPVKVFYAVLDNMANKQGFNNKLGNFKFDGRIEYVNKTEAQAEQQLIDYMFQSGAGSYTIIYEQ